MYFNVQTLGIDASVVPYLIKQCTIITENSHKTSYENNVDTYTFVI